MKKTWIAALQEGVAGAGLQLNLDDAHVHLPFYGNTLIQLVDKSDTVETVAIKGGKDLVGDAEAQLMAQVVKGASRRQGNFDGTGF